MLKYTRALSAFFGSLATWGITATADENLALSDWFGLFGVLATTFAVYQYPNKEGEPPPLDEGQC